nr:RagB/SusD family nutrient uptake outer membrane protein [uncultured Carboxylicivirga sp.]
MRKKYLYILIFGITTLFTSCEEKLDIPSEASLSANSELASSDVDKMLTGLYQRMMEVSNYSYFNIMATEIMGDNYKPVKFQWYQVQYLYEHKTPADDILLSYMYKDYYTGIDRANTIIKIPSASPDQIGRAKFCRALNYLRLYDKYESVPIVDENYNKEEIAPSSKEDVLKFIVEDLKWAKENCDPLDLTNLAVAQTMPSQEAAVALLARVYRLQGNIDLAGAEAEVLIKSGKFSLASNPKERTNEVIMRFAGNKSEQNGSWGWIMSPSAVTWNCFATSDELLKLIDEDDTRRILYDFENKELNGGYVFSKKYKTDDDSDLLVSRIAEMYLISAEAGNSKRLTELQSIRNSSLSLDDERRLEMAFEWTRWEDLKMKGETYKLPYPQGAVDANPLLK